MGQNNDGAVAPFRMSCGAVAIVLGAALAAAGCGSTPASPSRSAPPAAPAAGVDAAAFGGHGELAFISRGRLWVLDGATGTLRQVATPGMTPLDPAFSPDGRWLAFGSITPAGQAEVVWLASGNGAGAHQILAPGGLIGWSPAADTLAVTAGNTIRLVWPSGSARTLTHAPGLGSAVWSPDGSNLAVAASNASASTLASYPVTGGPPTVWLRLSTRNSMNYIDPAGWWRRQGIGFWAQGRCNSCNADGNPLYVIASPGAQPRSLGSTLADPSGDQVAAAANGQLAIVAETRGLGGGRVIWQDKAVKVCGPSAACTAAPTPPSTVTLDPAWSPDGSQLAYVQATYRASPAFPQHVVAAWYAAHQLWLYDPGSGSRRELDAAGASVPVWSANGNSLLYVARDAIWLLPRLSGRPVRVAGPLFPPGHWPLSYYGQLDWTGQFAWWSGSNAVMPSPRRAAPSTRPAALTLPPVGAPGFPVKVYPPPGSRRALNMVGECPNPSGLMPPGPGIGVAALAVVNSLGRSFRSDLRLSDRVYWRQTLINWRMGLENAPRRVSAKARRSVRLLYSGPLNSYHQAFGPPDMSRGIRAGCGARTARDTWMIVQGPANNPGIQGEILLLDRRGHVLVWNAQ